MAELVRTELTVLIAADADLPLAAARCAWGACADRGRADAAVRRIFVETAAHEEFRKLLVQNIGDLKVGPSAADVGPLSDEAAAAAVEERLKEAVARGARLWAGGPRRGALLPPALVENVPADARLCVDEFSAPVALLESAATRGEALERLAASSRGARAAVFTNDLALVLGAFERLNAAALIVNDVSAAERDDARPALAARAHDRTLVIRS